MKFVILLFLLCAVEIRTEEEWNFDIKSKEMFQKYWAKFTQTFKKNYVSKAEEYLRKHIFLDNVLSVLEHNEKYAKVSFKKSINKFSDMPHSEFREKMLGCSKAKASNRTSKTIKFIPPAQVKLPDLIDWRTEGAVTKVKNQEYCGSCYAFAAIGALEGQHFRKTKKLIGLSEQQLVDCSIEGYTNDGCRGGFLKDSFTYIKDNDGIEAEDTYPYTGVVEKCNYSSDLIAATDVGYGETDTDESHLEFAVATLGPIAVCIEARTSFVAYEKGIYYDPECSPDASSDHCLLVVGYGSDPNEDEHPNYWIVKNSWGDEWGEEGYIRMARNEDNNCGIASEATYPLV